MFSNSVFAIFKAASFARIVVTKVLKLLLFIFFGVNVTDANTPYRLMKRELLEKYIPEVPKKYFLSNVLLTVLFLYNDEKVLFLPIAFGKRETGVNSINLKRIMKIGFDALFDFFAVRKDMKKNRRRRRELANI